jgi:hypothetical protein
MKWLRKILTVLYKAINPCLSEMETPLYPRLFEWRYFWLSEKMHVDDVERGT